MASLRQKSEGPSYEAGLPWRNQLIYLGLLGRASPQKKRPLKSARVV